MKDSKWPVPLTKFLWARLHLASIEQEELAKDHKASEKERVLFRLQSTRFIESWPNQQSPQ